MQAKALVVCCFLIGLVTGGARADETAKAAKVEEYFQLAKMDEVFTQTMSRLMATLNAEMLQRIMGVKVPPERSPIADEFRQKYTQLILDTLSWNKLRPAVVKLYVAAFSDEELDGIVAFYQSPAGQALSSRGPLMMPAVAEISRQRMAEIRPEIQKLVDEFVARAKPVPDKPPEKL